MYQIIEAVLNKYATKIITNARQILTSLKKKATGSLYKSLDYEIKENNNVYEVEFVGVDYLQYVEDGRAKGKQPPLSKIQKWMQIKGLPNKDSKSAAFAIARNIGKFGIKPSYFLSKSIRKYNNELQKDMNNDMAQFLRFEIIKTIKRKK